MLYFDLVLSFSALLCLCAFFTLCTKLHSALAPLVALSCVSSWFTLAGVADLLKPLGWLGYALCWGLGAWAFARHGTKGELKRLLSPGAVLFWALGVTFAVYFALRQPMFSEFDEFSLWGTAAQMTTTNDRLFTVCEYGAPWQVTQNPGLIMLSYFIQFFGQFAPFKVYLAYDLLLFACIAALLGRVNFKNYRLAVPLAVIGWCTPWFFTTYARTILVSKVYMSAYGDIPAGMLIGGTAALWFALRAGKKPLWPIFPVLAFLANIKDNTFPLALITAALIAADYFLFGYETKWKQGWGRRLGFSALCMAMPLTLYTVWAKYIAFLVRQNAAGGGMGETGQSTLSVALNGTKLMLGLEVPDYYVQRAARFAQAAADMKEQFYTKAISMIGPGAVLAVLILAVFAVAVLFGQNARQRLRAAMWAVCSTLGFVAYNYVLTLSYAFIFKEFQGAGLTDYNRYMYTYYIGWFIMAAAVLAWTVQTGRARLLVNLGVLGFACLMLLRVNSMVLPQMSVLGFSDATFTDQYIAQNRAEAVKSVVGDARVFIVTQGDDGTLWFTYSCYFLPNVLDYSGWEAAADGTVRWGGGGGSFILPENLPAENPEGSITYYHPYTLAEMEQLIRGSGCGYIFVDKLDAGFTASYGSLFSDGLAAAEAGKTLVYKVEAGRFTPVEMEVPR